MKVLMVEVGETPCVVRVTLSLTLAERRQFPILVTTPQLVAYGVALLPKSPRHRRAFSWRTNQGRLPASVERSLNRLVDDYLETALAQDPHDRVGHLAKVFRTGRLPVPQQGSPKDPRKWENVDLRQVAAVEGKLAELLLEPEQAYSSVNRHQQKETRHLRLVK